MRLPSKITGTNAGGPRQLPMRPHNTTMTFLRHSAFVTRLAIFGALLPYAIAVIPSVMIGSLGYYQSFTGANILTLDTVTRWVTVGAFALGAVLCWPWFKVRLVATRSSVLWIALGVAAVRAQFVVVFFVRFMVYYAPGGPL